MKEATSDNIAFTVHNVMLSDVVSLLSPVARQGRLADRLEEEDGLVRCRGTRARGHASLLTSCWNPYFGTLEVVTTFYPILRNCFSLNKIALEYYHATAERC